MPACGASLPARPLPSCGPLQVTVFGKRPAEARYRLVASLDSGYDWRAADWIRLAVHPLEDEWPALAAKAGTR